MVEADAPLKRPSCIYWSEVEKWAPTSSLLRFGRLPNGWRLLPIYEFVAQIDIKERVESNVEYRMAGVRWYGEGVFHRETVLGKEQSAKYLYPLKPGAIIYNRLFAWKESFAVVPGEFAGFYVSNEFPQFAIDSKIALPDYIYLLFNTKKLIRAVNATSIGSAAVSRNRFKESDFLSFKVPIPPLTTQHKIVAYWIAANAKAKADISIAQKLLRDIPNWLASQIGLPHMGVAHSKRAFVSSWKDIARWGVILSRELSSKPDLTKSSYPVVSLSDVIADLQNGWSPKCLTRPAEAEEWGVLKVGAVSYGRFDEQQNKALPSNLKPREQYEVKDGDLIISRANITRYVGACALVEKVRPKLMLSDKLFRVIWKDDSPVLPKYLDEILKISHLRWQIENNVTGASPTMKNISKPALMGLKFPLPPLEVQKKIVSELNIKRNEANYLRDMARENLRRVKMEIEQMIFGTRPAEVN